MKKELEKKYSSGFQLVHQIGCYELLRGPDPFWLGIYRVFVFLYKPAVQWFPLTILTSQENPPC